MENTETPPQTKAERKQMRRAEKAATRAAAERRGARLRQARWLVAVAAIVAIIAGAVWLAGRGEPVTAEPEDASVLAVQADDWVRGNPAAAATVVEYGDFQCPACASYHPILRQLEAELGDRVRIVFRHFPLEQVHPQARAAAIAAEAAGRQGKFWEMHDLLFERQTSWAGRPGEHDTFVGYAAELGLNRDQFVADLDDSTLSSRVSAHQDGGVRLRVNSTPTFFLNGERLEFVRTYDEFKQRVLDALDTSS